MEKMERPKVGTLKIGDPVLIRVPGRYVDREGARWQPGTVDWVARVWITVKCTAGNSIRFRLDTQDDGTERSDRYYFVTPEQKEYDDRMATAGRVLADAGIRYDRDSPFSKDHSMTLALAERVAEIVGVKAP